jgi:hypothetical protein
MRRGLAILVAALIGAAAAAPASAATETVTGQVIDLACYMLDKGNTETTHRGRGYACAQACAREGFQVGLVTGDGKVYHVSGGLAARKNAKLVPHMGHVVTVTGEVTRKDNLTVISSDDLQMVRTARQEK